MADIEIIQGDFDKKLKLQFVPGIKVGFPSPAEDYRYEHERACSSESENNRKPCWLCLNAFMLTHRLV